MEAAHDECKTKYERKRRLHKIFLQDKKVSIIGLDNKIPSKSDRENDTISHWFFKLGMCKKRHLIEWTITNETRLFMYRYNLLTEEGKKKFLEGRLNLWSFFYNSGLPLEQAKRYSLEKMTKNVESEGRIKYYIEHAYGRKRLNMPIRNYTCEEKIASEVQYRSYHHCPFKEKRYLRRNLQKWKMEAGDIEDICNMQLTTTSKTMCKFVFRRIHAGLGNEEFVDYKSPTEYFEASIALTKGIHDVQLK
ncbi:Oidioi.mRNA.OKI2018_I69.chr2.g7157.t1.cds [Oikopleura dioica]|uniref:Oidioi.mRNA.OKI2018_I69.chr2.g7157.t1.cds n=1 Tax=Oikopleura dioica TaxID=34765 RepID=A0ABN7TED7_OIKDI|nr:Oidioi.mRNA.OKI2018_I69.chr2.g7157.t1.cds [Oikopleura dioica]